MILAFIEKHAAYISALKDGALRRNWVTAVFPMENRVAFEIVFVSVVKKVAPKCIGVNTEIADA